MLAVIVTVPVPALSAALIATASAEVSRTLPLFDSLAPAMVRVPVVLRSSRAPPLESTVKLAPSASVRKTPPEPEVAVTVAAVVLMSVAVPVVPIEPEPVVRLPRATVPVAAESAELLSVSRMLPALLATVMVAVLPPLAVMMPSSALPVPTPAPVLTVMLTAPAVLLVVVMVPAVV